MSTLVYTCTQEMNNNHHLSRTPQPYTIPVYSYLRHYIVKFITATTAVLYEKYIWGPPQAPNRHSNPLMRPRAGRNRLQIYLSLHY